MIDDDLFHYPLPPEGRAKSGGFRARKTEPALADPASSMLPPHRPRLRSTESRASSSLQPAMAGHEGAPVRRFTTPR